MAGELACRAHLAATVDSMMANNEVVAGIRKLAPETRGKFYCTCFIEADYYVVPTVEMSSDQPFPLFRGNQ